MKANELTSKDLMIGDWVLQCELNIPVKVQSIICHYGESIYFYHETREYISNVSKLEPIPLTPEILEENGILYEKASFYYIIKDDKDLECTYYIQQMLQGCWAIGVDIGAYDCSVFARIKYVHELQHALKLCGIDKEIKV